MNGTELIRWRIICHAFIDGKTRLVTGARFNNNNRADTVLELFTHATSLNGLPSHVRGDHGTENVRVADYMEEKRGVGRGSYIWGRYVSVSSPKAYTNISLQDLCIIHG